MNFIHGKFRKLGLQNYREAPLLMRFPLMLVRIPMALKVFTKPWVCLSVFESLSSQ